MGAYAYNPIPDTGRPYLLRLENYHSSGSGSGGATADQAAMTNAIAAANAAPYGAVIDIPPGDYWLAGPFTHDPDVHIRGAGYGQTTLNHTGNNALFTCLNNQPNFRHRYEHMMIKGNSGASAMAVDTGNAYGVLFDELGFANYTGNNAIRIQNTTAGSTFTEGLLIRHCRFLNNLRNIRCERNGGTDSLSDMRIEDCQISADLANSVDISLGANLTWYGGTLRSKMHCNRSTAVGVDVGAGTQWIDCDVAVVNEGYTSLDATAGVGIQATSTSVIRLRGFYNLFSGANTINHSVPSGGVFRIEGGGVGGIQTQGDANLTWHPDTDATYQLFNTNLTANRTITLSADKVWGGAKCVVIRDETTPQAFTLTVVDGSNSATLHTFAASTRGRAEFIAGRNSYFRVGANTF